MRLGMAVYKVYAGKCCIDSLPSVPQVKYFSQGKRYTVQLPLDRTFKNHLSLGNCEHLWVWFNKQQINKQLLQFVFTFLRSVATVKSTIASYPTQFLVFHIGLLNIFELYYH